MQTTDAARAPRPPGELGQDRSWLALRRCRRSGGRAGVRPRRGGLLLERGRRGRRRRGRAARGRGLLGRSEDHTSELQSPYDLVCRLMLEKKKKKKTKS